MRHGDGRRLYGRGLIVGALILCAGQVPGRGDAQGDYDRVWGTKEKRATTPSERAKLAGDLMKAAEDVIGGARRGKRKDTIAGQKSALEDLTGKRREEVLLLCAKAYEVGSKQQDGYAPAAKALGVIQEVDPEKRLDSLQKLQKMYAAVYQLAPSKNLGIAKGYADVSHQLGEEQWFELQENMAKGKSSPAQQVATLKAITVNYAKALEVVRAAESAIRPYAKDKREYEEFLKSAADVEQEIVESQKVIAGPLAASAETERNLKNLASLQGRMKANPADAGAADRLVRLYFNELDDPAEIENVLKQASPEVKAVVALMKKPVKQLTAAEAMTVVNWCDKANDNPASPNHTAMDIKTSVYCEAFKGVSKVQDGKWREVDLTEKRAATALAKEKLSEEKVKALAAAYVEALEPAEVVAVAPVELPKAEDPPKEGPAAEEKPAEKPAPAPVRPAVPARPLASIKVPEPEAAAVPARSSESGNSTIFDFGQ